MSTVLVLDQIRKNFERAALVASENFQYFDEIKTLCKKSRCEYCTRPIPFRDIHRTNMILLREMLEYIIPSSKASMKLELDPRPGYGLWNGFITDDGYFINGRIGVGKESGDVGHKSLYDDYVLVLGKNRGKSLLKLHAQRLTEVMLFQDSPVLTKAQVITLREIFITTSEELYFTFRYDLQHPMKDIPF